VFAFQALSLDRGWVQVFEIAGSRLPDFVNISFLETVFPGHRVVSSIAAGWVTSRNRALPVMLVLFLIRQLAGEVSILAGG